MKRRKLLQYLGLAPLAGAFGVTASKAAEADVSQTIGLDLGGAEGDHAIYFLANDAKFYKVDFPHVGTIKWTEISKPVTWTEY
jgi:hypothetical protein